MAQYFHRDSQPMAMERNKALLLGSSFPAYEYTVLLLFTCGRTKLAMKETAWPT
jgi:hypothetical protein